MYEIACVFHKFHDGIPLDNLDRTFHNIAKEFGAYYCGQETTAYKNSGEAVATFQMGNAESVELFITALKSIPWSKRVIRKKETRE